MMIKLSEYPSVSVVQARQMVHDNKNMLGHDLDSADERNGGEMFRLWLSLLRRKYLPYAKLHKRSWKDDESKLRREINQMLGKVPLTRLI